MTTMTESEIISHLYKLYHPGNYEYGDPIHIRFTVGTHVEDGDIQYARHFIEELRKQIPSDVAMISQRNSTVIVQPLLV